MKFIIPSGDTSRAQSGAMLSPKGEFFMKRTAVFLLAKALILSLAARGPAGEPGLYSAAALTYMARRACIALSLGGS